MARLTKGIVIPAIVYVLVVIAGGAALFFGHPKKPNLPPPPTKELIQAQSERDKAQSDLDKALKDYTATLKKEKEDQVSQVQYSQEMVVGAETAIRRIPTPLQGPEVVLGLSLLGRADIGLSRAIGSLPKDKQDEILAIVDGVLSKAQSEVDSANKALALEDANLKQVTSDRDILKGQVPGLKTALDSKEEAVKSASALVDQKTAQVIQYVKDSQKSQGLIAQIQAKAALLIKILIGLAIGWMFFAFILPVFGTILGPTAQKILHNVSGYLLSPVTHHTSKTS